MAKPTRVKRSEYIEWAKLRSQARFNLATSGIKHYPFAELPVTLEDIELNGPGLYGYQPLQQALAAKCGVGTENVVAATGTSMANHLAMASMLEPGDEVLIELPAYDPLVATASYLGANIKRFHRRFEQGFRVEPIEIERAVTNHTRLIVLTNTHNPTGAYVDNDTLSQVAEIARRVGARVLIDEVYLEAMYDKTSASAFHLGREFVTTGSLTKAYGLSGLRCGWILAEPALAEKMWLLTDLFANIPPHPVERLSVIALRNLEGISARAIALLEKNRPLLDRFLDSTDELETIRPGFGTVVAPRLKSGRVDELCALLREKYETSVVPGRFFEMPDHFRIGIGCDSEMLAEGLVRLGVALDELKQR
ncbi:MAG: aminotransferase class I/II-fold pyridoxal phosphate-dependent enzyme [Blastocatellia bacterium]